MTLLDRVALGRGDLLAAAFGLALSALLVAGVQREGTQRAFLAMFGTAVFVAVVVGFMRRPHILVAATIVYFSLLPTLKVFVTPVLGGTKDLIDIAALTAAVGIYLERRRASTPAQLEVGLLIPIVLLLVLYVLNLGGSVTGDTGHGLAWFHGVRLFAEPLCLFIVGAVLANPRRTLRWGTWALLAGCVVSAFYGIVQQSLGVHRLVSLGYTYGEEVRQLSTHLRSFGTAEEPFAYAGLLLLGLAALLLWSRWKAATWLMFAVIMLGLLFSYVRTAAVIGAALFALALARRGHARYAAILMLGATAAAIAAFVLASEKTQTRTVPLNSTTYLTLNGRTNIWASTLRSPADWVFGRGVGATGTASRRATVALAGSASTKQPTGGSVVDSSYFAVIADVGILGLGIAAVFFARLLASAAVAARRGSRAAWLAGGLLTVTLLDALTRESFTGFPTAYVAMLLVGVCYAVWRLEGYERTIRPAVP
jgi:hypothetical protein